MQQKSKKESDYTWSRLRGKIVGLTAFAVAVGVGPSQAAFAYDGTIEKASFKYEQESISTARQVLVLEEVSITSISVERFEEEVAPPPPPPPPPPTSTASSYSAPVAYGTGSHALLSAARAQIGRAQDCTAMVENALRAIGYGVGDLSPMGFAGVGYQVSPADAQPGDIMMRGGHVAIYAGNGVAVHGGFRGSTVETSVDGSPYNYAVIVRL